MLAQNFKSPAELGVSDADFDALVQTLYAFERQEVPDQLFDMLGMYTDGCRTPGCVKGWAVFLSKGKAKFETWGRHSQLMRLFCMDGGSYDVNAIVKHGGHQNIKPPHAAIALRNFLTHGEPRWAEALAN